jgi:uncharacterized protein with von Willebrand factor type A (vWA) domain
MGLCYNTTKWTDLVWEGHVNHSPKAQTLISQGEAKQDSFTGFAQDVHSLLYLPNAPKHLEGGPEWAEKLLTAAQELTEWQQLKSRCRHSGLASGIATEQILNALQDQVPNDNNKDNSSDELPYVPGGGVPGNGQGKPVAWTDATEEQKAELRSKIRRAVAKARDEVVKAEATLDGLEEPLQMNRPGKEIGQPVTHADLDHLREAHDRIKNDWKLQQIAELAGRLVTKASTHKRTKVEGRVGAIKGIELSGDIPRVLPSELAGLRGNKLTKLMTLSKIAGRRALSWKMEAENTEQRGPIVMLKDLSSSMEGIKDIWASAVALAILGTATKQKRDWTLIGFDRRIRHINTIKAGEATVQSVQDALRHAPRGGTDFDPPLQEAVNTIKNAPTMRKADIIIITDGEADLSDDVARQVTELTQSQGVQVYVIGIGSGCAGITKSEISKVATKTTYLATTNNETTVLFDAINLE